MSAPSDPLLTDRINATLSVLHEPDSIIEVRVFTEPHRAGYFDDHSDLADAVTAWDGKASVAVTLNEVSASCAGRVTNRLQGARRGEQTADDDIARRRWFLLDVDNQGQKPATDSELGQVLARRDEIVSWLREQGWPEPITAISGSGGHALWRVDLPNDEATEQACRQALKAIAQRFDDDIAKVDTGVANASRVCKLYGTVAVKGTATSERPHRRAEIQRVPQRLDLLTQDRLDAVACLYTPPVRRTTTSMPAATTGNWNGRPWDGDLVRVFEFAGRYRRELGAGTHAVVCPWSSEHSEPSPGEHDTSAAIFELDDPANRWGFDCKHAHCADRTIKDVYAYFRLGRSVGDVNVNRLTGGTMQDAQDETDTTGTATIDGIRAVIQQQFPGYWPAVEVGLATAATLLLRHANPTAIIYVGGPSCGKTTVASMFTGSDVLVADGEVPHELLYRSDAFTPAAFVSQAANVPKKELDNVDLLPRIRNKLLVTMELAPIFRGKEDDLTKTFSVITRVLDGQGLQTDSGTHGRRGYDGEYLFAWIGCTTPFDGKVWRVMAQLGSRLFFFPMDDGVEITVDDLLDGDDGTDYAERVAACRRAVGAFLSDIFNRHEGVRSVRWDADDPREVREWIGRFAVALARMRSDPPRDGDAFGEYVSEKTEQPRRAYAVLMNLARGHALVHGRRVLTEADLPLVAAVAIGTMPTRYGRVFRALMLHEEAVMTVSEVQTALKMNARETARRVMADMDALGVVTFTEPGDGKTSFIEFTSAFAWAASDTARRYVTEQPVNFPGLCGVPVTSDLVQRRKEEEKEEVDELEGGEVTAHTPQPVAGCAMECAGVPS